MREEDRDVFVALVAVLVDADRPDITEVLSFEGLFHMVADDAPDPRVMLADLLRHSAHWHVLHKRQDHSLHHEGEAASHAGPWNFHRDDLAVLAHNPRHPCRHIAAVLEEVQMPPCPRPRVVHWQIAFTAFEAEACPLLEVHHNMQLLHLPVPFAWLQLNALYVPWLPDVQSK